ncbi:MAG: hypothetical protein IPP90_06500 [Gemmatimonadaceae bacterium]|nr:hypothetical protein [Gemmatimonadaceae bacterium]
MPFRTLFTSTALAVLMAAGTPPAQPTAAPWYRRSRSMELTGGNPRDSVVLTATGKRPDSLAIAMTFYVAGAVAHRQRWTSEDELYDVDSLRASPTKLAAFMRSRLDSVLTSVKREPINGELVANMGDEAVLRKIVPRPTRQIMFSFAFETSVFLVWDPARRRLVVFMECC